MVAIRVGPFEGVQQRLAPHLIGNNRAVDADNARLDAGTLRPWHEPGAPVHTLASTGTVRTLYRWADTAWFEWTSRVSAVRGPVPGDTEARTYYTGDGAPKMTYSGIATSSASGPYPSVSYTLGVPAPDSAPTVSVTGTGADDSVAEERSYVYTYVSAKGEEGPPSPPSSRVEVLDGQGVDVGAMASAPAGNYNINRKRIYRTATSGTATEFQLVDEVDVAASSYSDTVDPADLGEILPSESWYPPPDDMHSLIALPNGVLAGLSRNQVCFSVPNAPHAWPFAYRYPMDADGVALAASGTLVYVATTGQPYVAQATDPESAALEKAETPYPCVSAAGMVDMGNAALYPGSDGLMALSGAAQPKNITEAIFSPQQWRALKPETIRAYRYEDRYIAFTDTSAFMLDPQGLSFTFLGIVASAGWLDALTGNLYLVDGQDVRMFNDGSALTHRWRSRVFEAPRPINPAAVEVRADSYPVHLKVWADGNLRVNVDIPDGRPRPLPAGYRGYRFQFEVSGTAEVRSVGLAETVEELKQQ